MSKGIAGKITGHCFTIAGRDRTWRFYRKPCSGSAIFKLAELWADIWICKSNRTGSWNPGHYIRTQYQDYDRKHYWCADRYYYLPFL